MSLQEKLQKIRQDPDVKLRPTPLLKKHIRGLDGEERPLVIRNYQAQAILHLAACPRFVGGDDTGLGKTLCTIAALCYVIEQIPNCKILIMTIKSAVPQWKEEFEKFTVEGAFKVFTILGDGMPYDPSLKKPKNAQAGRKRIYKAWMSHEGPSVLIMNYSLARMDVTLLARMARFVQVLVCDEAAEFSNPNSQLYQIIKLLATQVPKTWGLTATPIQNNLLNGYAIFSALVPGLLPLTETAFKREYCIMKQIPGGKPILVGYRPGKVEHFRALIDPHFLARSKRMVAKELPPVITVCLQVPLSPEQDALYEETLRSIDGDAEVGEDYDSDEPPEKKSKLGILVRLQQIANHPALIEGCSGASSKMDKLFEILTEGDLAQEKVLVYTRFRSMVDILQRECIARKIPCVRVTGSEDDDARKRARHLFSDESSNVRVCFITKAGGTGLNLQAARALVFFDTPWSGGSYEQAVGRMVRIGSTQDRCYVIHLVSQRTIDMDVIRTLNKKLHLIDQIVGDRLSMDHMATSLEGSEIDALLQAARERR